MTDGSSRSGRGKVRFEVHMVPKHVPNFLLLRAHNIIRQAFAAATMADTDISKIEGDGLRRRCRPLRVIWIVQADGHGASCGADVQGEQGVTFTFRRFQLP
jgi:hypothetical protein